MVRANLFRKVTSPLDRATYAANMLAPALVLIVVVLTAATLAYVSLQANQRVNARIAQDLARSEAVRAAYLGL
jgi:hypothetical protein